MGGREERGDSVRRTGSMRSTRSPSATAATAGPHSAASPPVCAQPFRCRFSLAGRRGVCLRRRARGTRSRYVYYVIDIVCSNEIYLLCNVISLLCSVSNPDIFIM